MAGPAAALALAAPMPAPLFHRKAGDDGVQELKLWEALVDHAQSLPDTDGDEVADVPASYATAAGRIIAE